jgi:hypothetical protein
LVKPEKLSFINDTADPRPHSCNGDKHVLVRGSGADR